MNVLKLLLFPLAVLYDLITRVRNYLYDSGYKPSVNFETSVIVVGNLNMGGAGKTPMVEYLIRLLKSKTAVAILSRGYKRETNGYRLGGESDSAATIGDEPFQLLRKFGPEVKVAVGEDRVFAIPHILAAYPETGVVILDDAFQHRRVKPRMSILVTEFARPFYHDLVLPSGFLREARRGASRADVIVVSKCPDEISGIDKEEMLRRIGRYAGSKPVFFSRIRYQSPKPFGNQSQISASVILVTGIANARPFHQYCKTSFEILKHFEFSDHYDYKESNLKEIEAFYQAQIQPCSILTTEKDMARLSNRSFGSFFEYSGWFYLPIEHEFLEDGLKFDELIVRGI